MQSGDQILKEGKFIRLVNRKGWEFVERMNITGIVVIAAATEQNEIILVEQYRPALEKRVIELPAGLAGDIPGEEDEAMQHAARRELLEETGYEASVMECVTEGPVSAGLSTEVVTIFRALNARKVGAGGGDESEDIKVHTIPITEVETWLKSKQREGLLVDPKLFAGLYFLK